MRNPLFFRTLLIFSLLCLLVCSPAGAQQEEARYPDGALKDFPPTFFAPADNYMAVLKDTTHPISFYVVHQEEQPFGGRTIQRIAMTNGENILFTLNEEQSTDLSDRLGARSLLTEATFPEAGRFEFDCITLLFTDGTRETYPIGRFVIEVFDDQDSTVLDTYVTTAMATNKTYLRCRYAWQHEDLAFAGLDIDLAAGHELLFAREEPFAYASEDSVDGGRKVSSFLIITRLMAERPTVYHFILPRVRVRVDGVEQAVYPKLGCYCGGLNVTETEVLEAYEAWYLT